MNAAQSFIKTQPWLEHINEDDLPTDELKLVCAFCGKDAVIAMLSNLQGLTIRIPTKGLTKLRNKYIREKHDGTKQSELKLAMEFGLDHRYIQRIIKGKD